MSVEPTERLTEDDRSQAAAEQFLERALAAQRRAAGQAPRAFRGMCLNCEESSLALFCSPECLIDYSRRGGR